LIQVVINLEALLSAQVYLLLTATLFNGIVCQCEEAFFQRAFFLSSAFLLLTCGSSYVWLQLNARMFNLPPDVNILHRAADVVDSFFEGTWMDGIGVVYSTPEDDKQQALEIVLNQTRARAGSEEPFSIHFLEKNTSVPMSSRLSLLLTFKRNEEVKKIKKSTIADRTAAQNFLFCEN
jgi:hypothetical protein